MTSRIAVARTFLPFLAISALGCDAPPIVPPAPAATPAFVYVADDGSALSQLVRYRNDSAVALTSGSNNYDPNSAASRLVFTSDRGGIPQLYIADLDANSQTQVTNTAAYSFTPSLSPNGDSIVYVSSRSGTSRLWLIGAPALNATTFDSAVALNTGTGSNVPESAPSWSPKGGRIAFSSAVSGVSQIYVVPSGGGSPAQVTNELGGAFQPAWSSDGNSIYYIAAFPMQELRRISVAGGSATTVNADTLGVGGPASCNASFCLLYTGPGDTLGVVGSFVIAADSTVSLFPRTAAAERQPTILVP